MAVNRAVQPAKPAGEPVDNYVLTTIPMPVASPKNVVVRVVLRPVNPTDILTSRWGIWANLDLKTVVGGSEGVGLVHELGEGVTTVEVGQRVIPLTWSRYYPLGYGLWRDYVEVPEIDLVAVPDNISDEVAAQFLINPWTAYGFFKTLEVPKEGYLLQTAAASVLGRQVISLAKYYGIKTINVVRRDEWIKPLKDIGADYVINSNKEDVKSKVKEITKGEGAYAALDPVGGETTAVVVSSVRDSGHVIVYGGLSGDKVSVNIPDLFRGVSLGSFLISDYPNDLPKRHETVKAIFELLSKKVIDPLIGNTYPLEEFKEALKETEQGGRGGKVFLASY